MKDTEGNIVCDESSSSEEWQEFYDSMTPAQMETLERIRKAVEKKYPGFTEEDKEKLVNLERRARHV